MKLWFFVLVIFFSSLMYAQEEKKKAASFVRVYDLDGTKLYKGKILQLTDSSLVVRVKYNPMTLEVSEIGFIKTKRSVGHNILLGAAIGVGTGVIVGLVEGDEDNFFNKGEMSSGLGVLFGAVGTGVGAITAIFKNSITYPIAGDLSNWKAFKEAFERESLEE